MTQGKFLWRVANATNQEEALSASEGDGRAHEQTVEPRCLIRLATVWKSENSLCHEDGRKRPCASCCWVTRSYPTPGTVARQAPLSMEFSRQEHWSGLPFLTPGNLPDPEIELMSPVSPALAGRFFTTLPPGKPNCVNLSNSLKSFWASISLLVKFTFIKHASGC